MAGGTCDCGGPGLESMSTKDLMWLERATIFKDFNVAKAAHEILRKRRDGYELHG